jgi:DUF1009 family protein
LSGGEVVGLIAGNLSLPILIAKAVKRRGARLVVAGLQGEVDPGIREYSDSFAEVPLGAARAMAAFFLSEGATMVALAGGMSREGMISRYDPDEDAIKIMEAAESYQVDAILRSFTRYLEGRGLRLVSVPSLVPELMIKPGVLTKKAPEGPLLEDLKMAFRLAKELGRLDCGQTVVVSDKIAVALEGADGTDETIRRGASLCRKPVAVAKVVKPFQDERLDLPVIGLRTIRLLAECKAGALALDAGGLIMLELDECLSLAEEAGLSIVAWREGKGFEPGASQAPQGGPGGLARPR